MKHISKALVVLSFLAVASAVQAQTTYFGTDFDGTTTYPYNDPTIYTAAPDTASVGAELNGQGGWTSTPGSGQVFTGGGNAFALLQSGANGVASHAILSTVGGYSFNVDFAIANSGLDAGGNRTNPGNSYAFNFTNALGTVFSINFAANGLDATPVPQLVIGGVALATASQGPAIDSFFHLTVNVTPTGDITASLGTPNTTLTSVVPLATAADGITGVSISETAGAAGAGTDFVQFDNLSVVVPEPSTYAMMGLGLLGMLGLMKFRRLKA